MAIDVWFPLVVYYADLEDPDNHNQAMARRILELRTQEDGQRTSPDTAWTGDVHRVATLHQDAGFEWLTGEIGRHATEYLKLLGHDLAKLDLYIQRSWPVVAQQGQRISSHAHYNAHVSAVYYVSVPEGTESGRLRISNSHRPNELSAGLGSNMTNGYREYNFSNFQHAQYVPITGRLLIFPAKQPHDVETYTDEAPRISVAYDLVVTARENQPGLYEYLMPPPSLWRRVPHLDSGE